MRVVIKQITKFFIIGVSAVMVDFIIYYLLSVGMNVNTDISKGLGFMVGTVYTYYLNKLWTWKYTERSNKGMVLKFGAVYFISFVFNVLINKYGLEMISERDLDLMVRVKETGEHISVFSIKLHKFLAFFFATLASAIINFTGQKFIVFKQVKMDPKDETSIEVS